MTDANPANGICRSCGRRRDLNPETRVCSEPLTILGLPYPVRQVRPESCARRAERRAERGYA